MLTVILAPVSPVLHVTVPLQFVAVNVAVSPEHNSLSVVVITGVVGFGGVCIVIVSVLVAVPQLVVHVAL